MDHGVKPGGDASEAKSNVCCSDTCVILSDVFKSSKETDLPLVIIISSFSSASASYAERAVPSSCGTLGSGVSPMSCRIGQLENQQLGYETYGLGTKRQGR